ncbi:MAG: type II secretion system GspH family protein [Chloroflexi bacterium]|nr:type II secretion system GspH family protein [Chloroflexota bacterium]
MKRGYILLEVLIGLALAAVTVPALLGGVSVGVTAADRAQDRASMYRLAQGQLEDVLRQPYDPLPAAYTQVPGIPAGYTIQITATVPVSYQYPGGSAAPETVQLITIRVDGPFGNMELQGYKVRE